MEAVLETPTSDGGLAAARELALGVLGGAALGIAASMGPAGIALSSVPQGLAVVGGAVAMTTPGLLVAHQVLRLEGSPEAWMRALSKCAAASGRLALGFAPIQMFFAVTTQWSAAFFVGLASLVWCMGVVAASDALVEGGGADLAQKVRRRAVVGSWALLSTLVALRLAWGGVA